jgi:hypothetical protein
MDNRPFITKAASVVMGVAYVALGALVVPVLGIACMLFIEEWSAPGYVNDDSAIGGLMFAAVTAMAYGVFGAPALWRRRPFREAPPSAVRQDLAPAVSYGQYDMGYPYVSAVARREAEPRRYPEEPRVPGHFWEVAQLAPPAAEPLVAHPIIPLTNDPVIEIGPPAEVDMEEIDRLEQAQSAAEQPVAQAVTTLMWLPVATPVRADDEVDDEAWFT